MVKRWLILIVLLIGSLLPTLAQAPLPLAVEYDGSLVVVNQAPATLEALPGSLMIISGKPTNNYRAIWSPDGTKLAYVISADGDPASGQTTLMVWDGGSQLIKVVENFAAALTINWTQDGRILYVVNTRVKRDEDTFLGEVYVVAPEAGAVPEKITGELPLIGGCGGDLFVPMEGLFWHETDFGGSAPFVALTDAGIVYSAHCQRYEISLFRPESGDRIPFTDGKLIRPAVSLDGQRVAGRVQQAGGSLGVVNLATLEETTIPTSEAPSMVTWGADGSLYYAAVSEIRPLLDGLSPEQLDAIAMPVTGYLNDVPLNRVRLYRIAPDGTETLLHEQEAYAVGRLTMHGDTLVYSTIANGDVWVQAMLDGTLTHDNAYERAEEFLGVAVNYLTLDASGIVIGGGTLPGDLRRFAVAP